ncbi:MAG: group II intron maturase-specific domain-containing protein, partial [Terriglobales bacterium]
LSLAVNEEKTRICRVPEGSFDFLGYTFGRCHSRGNGRAYLGTKPSRKSIKRICDAIRAETGRHTLTGTAEQLVKLLNRKLHGWANYFYLGPVTPAYRIVDRHANYRLRQWLCRKHQVGSKGIKRFPDRSLYDALGLIRLTRLTHDLPWAKA